MHVGAVPPKCSVMSCAAAETDSAWREVWEKSKLEKSAEVAGGERDEKQKRVTFRRRRRKMNANH